MGRIKDSDSEGEDPNAVWAPDRKKKKRKAVSEEVSAELDYNATVKKRNFKFKRFKQRVKEVDVNVFKRVGKARAEPLEGCDSFLQEAINEWRELNTAESFCEVVQALHEKCGSLILIVHHQSHILDVILSKFQYQEQLSLDGLLALMEALARDLENDFYPHLPRVIDSIVELLADGAVRDTDLIQHIFTRLNQVFKYTRRSLAADLPGVLRMTVALRHQRHGYIRHFVAVGLGFIFRSSKDIASGFQFLIEEAAAHNPGKHDISRSELAHSLGELVAEIVKGVSNGLHSRTEEWLQHSLTQQRKSVAAGRASDELVEMVMMHTVTKICEHVRRESCAQMWGFLLTEANSALEDPDRDSVVQAVLQINLVSCATEFYRGSRVPDYAPLFQLVERALDTAPAPEAVGTPKATRTRRSQAAAAQVGAVMEKDQRLPEAALRLILALTAAHMREVGASGGASVIASNLTRWAPAFRNASPAVALSSVARLQSEVGRGHFLGIYAEVVFEVVERCIQEGGEICSKAAALLGDVCEALRQAGKLPAGRKKGERRMLLEARAPPTLVQWVRSICEGKLPGDLAGLQLMWGGLRCLPYSVSTDVCVQLATQIDIASSAASRAAAADLADVHVCLQVASHTAVRLAVEMALGHVGAGRRALLTVLPRSLALATRHAGSLVAVRSAAELLQALQNGVESEGADGELYALLAQEGSEDAHVSEAAEALGWGALREALGGPLGLNLQHPSADMRLQTLSVFAHFQPPPPVQGPGVSAAEVKAPAELGLTMYGMGALRNITAGELNLDAGRHTQVSLGKVHKKLAAKLVPEELVAAVCRALVGCLHVRFSLLWDPATEALGAALSQYPLLAWPVVHAALIDCQAEALGGGAVEAKGGAPADDGEGAVTGLATLSQSAKAAQAILVDSTDATTRLGHLLKTLGKAPGIANNRIKELAPMFMAYTTAVTSPEGSAVDEDMETEVEPAEEETAVSTQVVAKDAEVRRGGGQGHQWRIGLRAWLELVGHLKALRSAEHTDLADALCRLLQTLLGDIDPGVQRLSLAALKVWKLQWLMPYMEHLENLCEPDNLREELTRFVVGRDVEGVLILEEHRREVTPVIIRLLQPSLRRRTGRLGGRGAPGSARSAVLNFLSALEAHELVPLFRMLLEPLSSAISPTAALAGRKPAQRAAAITAAGGSTEWWATLGTADSTLFARVDLATLVRMRPKLLSGFLNTAQDLLGHLGDHTRHFMDPLLSLTLRLLQHACSSGPEEDAHNGVNGGAVGDEKSATAMRRPREMRGQCLKLLGTMLDRYPDADFEPYWPTLLEIMGPMAERLAGEAAGAASSGGRPPAMLEVVRVMAENKELAPVLWREPRILPGALRCISAGQGVNGTTGITRVLAPPPTLWRSRSHGVALSIVEGLLDLGESDPSVLQGGVVPQAELLLEELRVRMVQAQTPPPVVNTTAGKGQGATTGPKRKPQRPHKALVPVRELSMLQRLAPHAAVGSGYTGALVAALLPFLQAYLKQRKLPELAIQRVLDVLGMLFHHTPQRVRPSAGCGG
ncbi:hypothetical protein CYMTET_20727, partial [Cymbomonas tetramitiformis]